MLRALMFILPLALTIYACVDCVTTPDDETKHLPKLAWVVLILLFPIAAPIVWFVAGKERRAAYGRSGGSARWVAPDDNPEFLRSLREEEEDKDRDDKQDRDKDS